MADDMAATLKALALPPVLVFDAARSSYCDGGKRCCRQHINRARLAIMEARNRKT